MRKTYIIIISAILAIITGIAIGVIIDNNRTDNSKQLQKPKLAEERNELSNEIQIISTSTSEESPLKKQLEEQDNHYVIRDNNGYIYVYLIDSNEKETLYQITEIVTSYLPQTDQIALKEGIRVVGKEELNATLEDYE